MGGDHTMGVGGGGPGTCNAHPYIYLFIYLHLYMEAPVVRREEQRLLTLFLFVCLWIKKSQVWIPRLRALDMFCRCKVWQLSTFCCAFLAVPGTSKCLGRKRHQTCQVPKCLCQSLSDRNNTPQGHRTTVRSWCWPALGLVVVANGEQYFWPLLDGRV